MDNYNDNVIDYDPEKDSKSKYTRLPFGLCKSKGIPIQDWWTPKDAWAALQRAGYVHDVSDEYAEYYRKVKASEAREARKRAAEREKQKKIQLSNIEHNPDNNYIHIPGHIAGAKKGDPMDFRAADSGNCNPYYMRGIGYQTNCQTCVAVYYARRLGYDVRTLPNLNNRAIRDLSYDTGLAYINSAGEHPPLEKIPPRINKYNYINQSIKDGHIYTIQHRNGRGSDGHILIAERKNGSLSLYDPQTDKIYDGTQAKRYIRGKIDIGIRDLSGYDINTRFCDKIMKAVKK